MTVETSQVVPVLKNIATRLRIESIRATTEAGGGHPTTCMSAADLGGGPVLRRDALRPAPIRSTSTPIASCCRRAMRRRCSTRPGPKPASSRAPTCSTCASSPRTSRAIPTPRLPFVDVATGSLGQGLCAGIGIALNARRIGSDYRTYVLMGDGESAEGSVWEAAAAAEFFALDNLVGLTDVNALGQSRRHPARARPRVVRAPLEGLRLARHRHRRPRHGADSRRAGRGAGHHGPAHDDPGADAEGPGRELPGRPAQLARQGAQEGRRAHPRARRARRAARAGAGRRDGRHSAARRHRRRRRRPRSPPRRWPRRPMRWAISVATREAYGTAIAKLGAADPRVVALDADVKNSTFSERFEARHPNRFYQCFIAEQVMIGAAMGLASRGAIPFPSTFAAFLSRGRRLHPHGRHQRPQREAGRVARGRLDWRRRRVADGARRPGDDERRAEHDGALSERRGLRRAAGGACGLPSRTGLPAHVAAEDAGDLRERRALPDRRIARCCARARTTSPR